MSAIATLVIYLSASDGADPGAEVLRRSAQEILGAGTSVTLSVSPSEAFTEPPASDFPPADATARIAWLDGEHRRATVRCYIGKLHRRVEREVEFDAEAIQKDRERMLGFVVASMLPSEAELAAQSPTETPKSPKPRELAERSPSTGTSIGLPSHFVGMAEVVGLGASGVGGSGAGFGAAVGGRLLFARSLSLRVAGGLRRGAIAPASATSEVQFFGVGLAFESPLSAGSPFALGGRSAALLLRHEVTHLSSDDRVPDRRSRVLPGADALFEASWHFSASAGVVFGIGAELAFGHTDVLVKGNEVADIPPLRAVAEIGLQAKF